MPRFCCEPVGVVVRGDAADWEQPSGRSRVIAYNEELMTREARIVLREPYCRGIQGIRAGMLLWVIWYADRAPSGREAPLTVHPFMDTGLPETGVFATRSPARPCPLGLTLVHVEAVEGCSLVVTGLDALDGTPVLDLKPYTPGLDDPREARRRAEAARSRPSRDGG